VDFEESPETEKALQEGFNEGFSLGLEHGIRWGQLQARIA